MGMARQGKRIRNLGIYWDRINIGISKLQSVCLGQRDEEYYCRFKFKGMGALKKMTKK